jgi:uncharacterized membrane protein
MSSSAGMRPPRERSSGRRLYLTVFDEAGVAATDPASAPDRDRQIIRSGAGATMRLAPRRYLDCPSSCDLLHFSTVPFASTREPLPRGARARAFDASGLGAALAVASAAWLALVVAAPWSAHRESWLAPLLYALFDPVCHQIAERSFHLWGEPLAACHRCVGLYVGCAIGIVSWPSLPRAAARLLARPRWILAFSIPLAIDALLIANTAASRLTTGLIAGFPVALLVLAATAQIAAASAAWRFVATPRGDSAAPARRSGPASDPA